MNQEEIIFNKLHDIFKKAVSNKNPFTVIECANLINVSNEKLIKVNEFLEEHIVEVL